MRGGIIFLYTLLGFFFLNLLVSWFSPAYRTQVGSFVDKVRTDPAAQTIPIGFQEGRSSLTLSPAPRTTTSPSEPAMPQGTS